MSFLLGGERAERLPVLALPSPAAPVRRAALPLFASLVPVLGALVLWFALSTPYALLFAALGPLMAFAALIDGARSRKRERIRDAAALAEACRELESTIDACHDAERDERWLTHPDVAMLAERSDDWWRAIPEREETLVVGTGAVRSALEVAPGDERPEAERLRERATWIADAPLVLPLTEGVFVRGVAPLAAAVARGLALQAALVHPPSRIRLQTGERWALGLPHSEGAGIRLVLAGPHDAQPPSDALIAWGSDAAPPACAATIDVTEPDTATLTWRTKEQPILVEAVSFAQAEAVVAALAERSSRSRVGREAPAVRLDELLAESERDPLSADASGGAEKEGLAAPVGRDGSRAVVLDLVHDGPHAIVVGTTGSGKSELLVSWVSALAARHAPERLAFLLADFKGGTAFERLAALPHVTGIITDLEGGTAARAVESLSAEMRRRERALLARGVRAVEDSDLPRLVIVVDEFAALVQEHPQLHAVFVDIVARGRALGMHLVLGTQRHTGVVREALLANCPLRIALRVHDAAESRTLLGSDDAALIPGGAAGRGVACVLRAGDVHPSSLRVALTSDEELSSIVARWDGAERAPGPWLPPLPEMLLLGDMSEALSHDERVADGRVLLGLCDDPTRQRQDPVYIGPGETLLAVGGSRAGKSTIVDLVAAQLPHAIRVPAEPEAAWDVLSACAEEPPRAMLLDDVDLLLATFPDAHGAQLLQMIERLVRSASQSDTTIVCSAQRLTGVLARLAELFSRRAVLHAPSKLEHISLGGPPDAWEQRGIPGRAWLDGRLVQFAVPPTRDAGFASEREASARPVAVGPRDEREEPRARPLPHGVALAVVTTRQKRWLTAGEGTALPGRILRLAAVETQARLDDLCAAASSGESTILVGDGEEWQQRWALLQEFRQRGAVVVTGECGGELRGLLGVRELPPYLAPGSSRGWLIVRGEEIERVALPPA